MPGRDSLEELRGEVDRVDEELVRLINERAALVQKLHLLKKANNEEVYVPTREKEVYERVKGMSKGPLPEKSVEAIYREIMSACLALQKKVKVGYLGPPLTFSHLAAKRKFGSSVEYVPSEQISDVFKEVWAGRVDYGVVPVENSTVGAVTPSLDMFIDYDMKVCAEVLLEIHHNLMARSRNKEITRVYSHAAAMDQCRNWIGANLGKVERVLVASTVEAAKKAASEDGAGAIGSIEAAEEHKLEVVAESIEDIPGNVTRFWVIGRGFSGPSGDDKTSVICSIKDRVGALYEMLEPLRRRGVNLSWIESRPSRRKAWDYCFFLDMKGHCEEKKVKDALEELRGICMEVRVLGSYPAAS